MEDQAGWHGKTPNAEELSKGLQELQLTDRIPVQQLLEKAKQYQSEVERRLEAKMPKFTHNYWWNCGDTMKVKMEPTRKGFGQSLAENGDDERVVCLGLDISGSITISDFYAGKPERKTRWISMGIAEQSATSAAAGLAQEGKLPVMGTYATFAAARNLDQIRTSVCYGNFNVMIAGAHGGVSVGPDGATHQALEDLFAMQGLPNMSVVVPCDIVETRKATNYLLLQHKGPKYIRFAREATPVVTDEKTPFVFGQANVIRLRHEGPSFLEAFETVLAASYKNEEEDLSIVACGPMVPEAMRAAYILKKRIRLRVSHPEYSHSQARRCLGDCARRSRYRSGRHRRRASDRCLGVAGQRNSDREPQPLWPPADHRRYRCERPFWRLRSALGVDQGIRSQRRTHRPQGRRTHGDQKEGHARARRSAVARRRALDKLLQS